MGISQIKFKRLHDKAVLPKAAHVGDGLDLSAVEECILQPNVPTLVKTGWAIELPPDHRAWVTPRSGLALKHGVTVWNAPGLVDELYRGEVGVILLWSGENPNVVDYYGATVPVAEYAAELMRVPDGWVGADDSKMRLAVEGSLRYWGRFRISPRDRIAQLTFSRIEPFDIAEADELSETARATGGFGSTGR